MTRILTRDENFDFQAAYWSDTHGLLYNALPETMFLWGHKFLSFTMAQDKTTVKVKTLVMETQEIVEVEGDLLVAADGCLSLIRKTFLPDFKLRFEMETLIFSSRFILSSDGSVKAFLVWYM